MKVRSTSVNQRKHTLRLALAFLAACVVLAFMVEATLRFGIGLGNPVLIAEDSACSYILKPDQSIFRFFVHTQVNRYGMRSDEVPAVRDPNVLRILFVGDSVTYGTSRVDQSQIFSEILHRRLPSIVHRSVEVLNASASAWAIDNELSYVRSRGTFASDIVLLVLNSGDLTQPRSTIADVGEELPTKRPYTAIGEIFTRYIRPRIFSTRVHVDAGDSALAHANATVRANLSDLDSFDSVVTSQHARFAIIYLPFRRDIPDASKISLDTLRAWSSTHRVPLLDLTSSEASWSAKEITLDGST